MICLKKFNLFILVVMKQVILVLIKDHLLRNLWMNMELQHILIYKFIIDKDKKIFGKIKLNQKREWHIGIIKMINCLLKMKILFIGGV
jgi:hypothetical protein